LETSEYVKKYSEKCELQIPTQGKFYVMKISLFKCAELSSSVEDSNFVIVIVIPNKTGRYVKGSKISAFSFKLLIMQFVRHLTTINQI